MEFDEDARLDAGQVQDRRGRSGGGRLPGGKAAIGGIGGVAGLLIVLLVAVLGGGDGTGSDVFGVQDPAYDAAGEEWSSELATSCRTGADANAREDCRIVGVVNSVQSYWTDEFAESGLQYQPADTQLFTGSTVSGCGSASSATGPFYCPADSTVYMDLSFFGVLTEPPFDARGGPFAQAYVVAHEYGHHVQNLLGRSDGGSRQGADSGSVRLELQADCYAGIWVGHASSTKDPQTGVVFLDPVTPQQLSNALSAAQAVGDDHIQQQSGGGVNPDTWTHGSSAQREKWFTTGYQKGTLAACDTFSASSL